MSHGVWEHKKRGSNPIGGSEQKPTGGVWTVTKDKKNPTKSRQVNKARKYHLVGPSRERTESHMQRTANQQGQERSCMPGQQVSPPQGQGICPSSKTESRALLKHGCYFWSWEETYGTLPSVTWDEFTKGLCSKVWARAGQTIKSLDALVGLEREKREFSL